MKIFPEFVIQGVVKMISLETVLILGFVALVGALIISTNLAIKLSLENDRLKLLLGKEGKNE